MNEFLSAKLIRIIVRGEVVIGRYGRRGYLTGALHGHVLTATLRDDVHQGHLTVTFDPAFKSFCGFYATVLATEPQRRPCSGSRLLRRPKTSG
jgi:hypothetical protein